MKDKRRCKITLTFCVSCLFVLLLVTGSFGYLSVMCADGGKTSFENYPIYISGTYSQNRVRIAVGPHGDIYAVWKEGSNVVFSMSSDRGRSWLSSPVTVAVLNGGNDFSIAVDVDDNVYVAIANINDGSYYWGVKKLIRYASGGITFEYHASDSRSPQEISGVSIATGGRSGDTYAYLVYKTTDNGDDVIRGRKSTSWNNEINIVGGVSGVTLSYPSVAIFDNKVAVVYNRNSTDIMLALDEGMGFSITTISSESSTQPAIAFEKEDIYLVWRQGYDIKACHYRYTSGSGWSIRVVTTVDDIGTADGQNPVVAISPRGEVVLAWEDSRYSAVYSTDVYFDISSDNASTFSIDERVNRDYAGAKGQSYVSICAKYGYGPYLAWEDYRSGSWKVYFEDIGLGRPYKIEEISSIGGVSLPEYRINDIVNHTGVEMKNDICSYNFGTNTWTALNPSVKPSQRSETALSTIPGTTKALLVGGYNESGYLGDIWVYDYSTTSWSGNTPGLKSITDTSYGDFSGGTCDNTEVEGYSGLDGTVVLSNDATSNRIVSSSVSDSSTSLSYDLLWVQNGVTLTLTSSSGCTINVDTLIVDGTISADSISQRGSGSVGQDATQTAGGGGGGGGGYGGAGGRGGDSAGGQTGGNGGGTVSGVSTGGMGGDGGASYCSASGGYGLKGGGLITINARCVIISSTGKITTNGGDGSPGGTCSGAGGGGGGGGGSGGCIKVNAYEIYISTGASLQAKGGNGGNGGGSYYGGVGGGGGGGRIFLYHEGSYTMSGSYDVSGGSRGSSGGSSGAQNGGVGTFTNAQQSYKSSFTYSSSGTFISGAKYISSGVGAWKNLTWSAQLKPNGTEIKFQLRSGNSLEELNSATFVGPDGTSYTYYTTSGADITNLQTGCYVQYKAYFMRGAQTWDFAALKDVTINYFETCPSARAGHAMCKVDGDDKVVLFGGNDGTGQFGDTYIFDYSNNAWTKGSTGPVGRTQHAIASIKGTDKILLFGGWRYNSGLEYLSDTWIYDVSENTWSQLSIPGPSARAGHAMATVEDTSGIYRNIILFGGNNASRIFGDTWLFRWDTITGLGSWIRLGPFLEEPLARTNHTMCSVYNMNRVMLYGGENERVREDAWFFDLGTNVWKRIANGTAERTSHAMTMIDNTNYVLVFGGNLTYHYTIFAGYGYVSILKYTANNPKLRNLQLTSSNGGTSCNAKAATIRDGKAIVVGSSSAQAEIWNIDIKDEISTSVPSITWSTSYKDITEVCYDGISQATLMMAWTTTSKFLLKVDKTLKTIYEEGFAYPINAICSKGDGGYYVFAYNAGTRENLYYSHNGALTGTVSLLSISGGPKGQINDAATAVISRDPIKTFTYLAGAASIGDSTRGLYKMIRDGTTYSIEEVDVNGDGNCSYFNYTAIDICADNENYAKNITILAAGANYYTKLPSGGTTSGFFAVIKEKLDGNVWKSETFAFESMRKNEFCATKIVDHKYNDGVEGYVAGLVNSPSLFSIKSAVRGSFTLITLYSLDPPTASNVRISIPGDGPNVNRMNEQFAPTGTNRLEFWVNITDPDTLSDLESVKFQAWYDDPDGDGIEDNWTKACTIDDKNGRVEIICTRGETGSYNFELNYPTSKEVSFDSSECSAVENGNTVELKFSYIPLKQARYSQNGTYGDGVSCANTWNFQFVCTDGVGERSPIGGGLGDGYEFGYQKVTSLTGAIDREVRPNETLPPRTYGLTDNFTLIWSANNDYRVGISINTPLADGENIIDYENVMVCEAKNETVGYPGNRFETNENVLPKDGYKSFEGLNSKIYWYGTDKVYWEAPKSGNEQSFNTSFLVYVPPATKVGNYSATLTYSVEISDKFTTSRILNEMKVVGTGEGSNNYFGNSVSCAGDVNGDGYDDVIIGAYGYSSYKGKAYLYLGSDTGLSTTPSWTATGEDNDYYFGISVSSAGDVNGDGYDDVIIGADKYSSYTGKAYLYLGSKRGLSTTPSWTATGEGSDYYFGYPVSSAGDVNGDGYDDVIIGAYGYSSGKGKVYLYLGSASGLSSSAWTAVGANDGDNFGCSVACAGDVNGDGYDDVIIGAYSAWYNGKGCGKAYIFLGGKTSMSSSSYWAVGGEWDGDSFGKSVAVVSHVNGDGYPDIIIGARSNDTPQTNDDRGKAYLFMGTQNGLETNINDAWLGVGEGSNYNFGSCVASAGDVNGDGYEDILVSATGYSSSKGIVYIYI